jgi:hypothetical protein
MKTINITSAVLSVLLIGVSFYYIDEVHFVRWRNSFKYDGYSAALYDHSKLTIEAGLVTALFFAWFVFAYIKNLSQQPPKNAKLFSIIGLCLTVCILLWDGLMISSASHISFDEVGIAWIGYSLVNGIIYFLLLKRLHKPVKNEPNENEQVLDDLERIEGLEL